MKLVSIIVATYKRDESLYNALDSLTKQTYENIEVIVIDDSADIEWNKKTEAIVDSFHDRLPITYIKNVSNQGSAKTRNIGINVSNGEYITFLDDDDLYLPNKISNQVDLMVKEDADYSLTNISLYNYKGAQLEIRRRDYLLGNEGKNLLLCHLKYHMTGTDTMMFKREYIVGFGGFSPIDVGDEFYLMLKAIEHGGKFVYCNECDVKAFVHTGEEGLSSGQSKIDGENKLFEFKKSFFKNIALKDKRYIKMRHHAVLAFAFKRMGKKAKFVFEGLKAFLVAPMQCIKLMINLK